MTSLIARWDQWKPTSLLRINLGIAAFILVAHIGGTLAYIAEAKEPKPQFFSLLGLDDLVAALILVSGVAALIKAQYRQPALRVHTIVLSLLAMWWVVWGFSLAFGELPKGNFAWNPLLFAFLCAYPVYLIRRTYLAHMLASSPLVNYAHVIVAGGSLILSAFIMQKVMQTNV